MPWTPAPDHLINLCWTSHFVIHSGDSKLHQLVVHQDPLVVLCTAAPQPAGPSLYRCVRLSVTDAVTSLILVKLFGARLLVHISLLSPENLPEIKYLFYLRSGIG